MTPLDQIQPQDDFARLSAERAEAQVGRAIRASFTALAATLDPLGIAHALDEGRYDDLWRHLALHRIGPILRPALNRLAVIHDKVAIHTTAQIQHAPTFAKARPSTLRTPDVIALTYDPVDPATVARQHAFNQRIAADVQASAEQTAQSVLERGFNARASSAAIARDLRESLGITDSEAKAIATYRAALEAGQSTLDRRLRDQRYDAAVRRGDMNPDMIDRMVDRYATRYRAFRAQGIASTETLRAANEGRRAAWTQYASLTRRAPGDIKRFWLTAGDELVCHVCAPIPGMNPDGIGLDEQYKTPIGAIDAPPDPHPRCRCSERFMRSAPENTTTGSASGASLRVELDYGP